MLLGASWRQHRTNWSILEDMEEQPDVLCLGVYVNGYRIIDQRVMHGDTSVVVKGDVSVAEHPFKLPVRPPR